MRRGSTGRARTRPSSVARQAATSSARPRRVRAAPGRPASAAAAGTASGRGGSAPARGPAPACARCGRRRAAAGSPARAGRAYRADASTGTIALSLPGRVSAGASWSVDVGLVVGGADPDPQRSTGWSVVHVSRSRSTTSYDGCVGDRHDRRPASPQAGGRVRSGVSGSVQPHRAEGRHGRHSAGAAAASRRPSGSCCPPCGSGSGTGGPASSRSPAARSARSCAVELQIDAVRRDLAGAERRHAGDRPVDRHRAVARRRPGTRWRAGPARAGPRASPSAATTALSLRAEQGPLGGGEVGGVPHEHPDLDAHRRRSATSQARDRPAPAAARASPAGPARSRARSGLGRPTASMARTR